MKYQETNAGFRQRIHWFISQLKRKHQTCFCWILKKIGRGTAYGRTHYRCLTVYVWKCLCLDGFFWTTRFMHESFIWYTIARYVPCKWRFKKVRSNCSCQKEIDGMHKWKWVGCRAIELLEEKIYHRDFFSSTSQQCLCYKPGSPCHPQICVE